MKNRPLRMDAWGISYDEYKELFHFCQQYPRKKQLLADTLGIRAYRPSPAPAFGGISDPVAAAAIRRERWARDVDMIERAANKADPALAPFILRAVTTKDGVRRVNPPCGRGQFIEARRRFFYLLSLEKN